MTRGVEPGMLALVTGGAGFLGSHLVDRLVDGGVVVTVVDDLSSGDLANVNAAAQFHQLEIQHPDLAEIVAGHDLVFHLAASATTKESSVGWADPRYDLNVNGLGTLNVLEAMRRAAPESAMVFASSAAVYGVIDYVPIDETHPTNPVSPYGVTKLAGEKYCMAYHHERGLDVSILRVFNTYGPRQPRYVMHDLVMKLVDDPTRLPIIGDGSQLRDYSYVTDTVEAFMMAVEWPGETLNLASGVPTRVSDVAALIRDLVAPGAPIVSEGETWVGDIPALHADISKIRAKGFEPKVRLDEGIRRLLGSYGLDLPLSG